MEVNLPSSVPDRCQEPSASVASRTKQAVDRAMSPEY